MASSLHLEVNDEAFEWLTSCKGMHPGHGLVLLEMQQRAMRFLVDVCKAMMHDIPANALMNDECSIQPQPPLQNDTVNGFASLAIMAAEAPYRHLASMKLVRLESLLAAKVSAAEDHVWSLREDPGYFAESLFEFKKHRQAKIKGKGHALVRLHREEKLWKRIIGNLIGEASLELEVWRELHSQVRELQRLHIKYEAHISIDKDLLNEYLDALLKFQCYLNQASKCPLGQLKHAVVASPPLRANYPPPADDRCYFGKTSSHAKAERQVR